MAKIVKLTEAELIKNIKNAISSYMGSKEEPPQFYDELQDREEMKMAEKFIKDIKAELERPYLGRFKSWDEPRKMRKPKLKEIIGAIKRVIADYENM